MSISVGDTVVIQVAAGSFSAKVVAIKKEIAKLVTSEEKISLQVPLWVLEQRAQPFQKE
jgi:hypothetical protein